MGAEALIRHASEIRDAGFAVNKGEWREECGGLPPPFLVAVVIPSQQLVSPVLVIASNLTSFRSQRSSARWRQAVFLSWCGRHFTTAPDARAAK